MLLFAVNGQGFKRFHPLVIFLTQDNFRTRYGQLVTFTTHVLNQNTQVKLATS